MRWFWLILGHFFVVVGIAGVFLPILPGTPLLILAAACYSKGSVRFENWLLNHQRYGPVIQDWRRYRVIPLKAKFVAVVFIAAGLCLTLFIVPAPTVAKFASGIIMPVVTLFIISRPSKSPELV